MHSGPDRPTGGQSFDETNKETYTATNKVDFAKSSIRSRPSKIKFSREEFSTRTEGVSNQPSVPCKSQSPPTTPTQQQVLSPVASTTRATDTAVSRMASFQDIGESRGRVNGRLDSKPMKSDIHIPDGILPNSIGNKTGCSSLITPPTPPASSTLTFVDSCPKSKQAFQGTTLNLIPTETESHKGLRLTSTGGTFFRRRSMRTTKSHAPLLSGVIEDTDQVTRHSLFSGTGMPAILEAGTSGMKNSSIELNDLDSASPNLSVPIGEKHFIESGASSLSEHDGDCVEKSGQSEDSRASPNFEKHSTLKNMGDDHGGILIPSPKVVQTSCQEVKSWWMHQLYPDLHSAGTAPTTEGFEKNISGTWSESKDPFLPSVMVTNRQDVVGRFRRRKPYGGSVSEEQEAGSFGIAKRRFFNDPVA